MAVTPTRDLVYVSSYGDRVADVPDGGGGGEESSTGALAPTGFDPLALAAVAVVLTLSGVALVAMRRRTTR